MADNRQPTRRSVSSQRASHQASPSLGESLSGAFSRFQRSEGGAPAPAPARATGSRREGAYRVSQNDQKASNLKTIIVGVVVVLAFVLVLNFLLHLGKIHNNVFIGDVDVSGMKKADAIAAVDSYYGPILNGGTVTAYSSPNVKSQKQADDMLYMISVNGTYLETHPEIISRVISATELEATVCTADLVDEAYKYGRGLKGLFTRLSLIFNKHVITPYAAYGPVALQSIKDSFEPLIGTQTVDCNVVIEDGYAYVVSGQDGYVVDPEQFKAALDKAFFSTAAEERYFAVYSTYTPMAVDEATAQAVADQLNNAFGDGAVFMYNGMAWSASPLTVSKWIKVSTETDEKGAKKFVFSLDESAIHSFLLKWILTDQKDSIPVSMEVSSKGKVTVKPDVSGKIPALADCVAALYVALFGDEKNAPEAGAQAIDGVPVSVSVTTMSVPSSLSIEEAIKTGVVSPIASFSTSYINGSTTDNRTHNVLLAASMINGTVVKKGEEFSFNAIVGDTSGDNGFALATVIGADGAYTDGYGGGTCQVSTTLFNAVYEAGLPVTMRRNHSMYSANYPDGRDATVDFPTTDFRFINDTNSDLYIAFTDDGTNLICTLYGEDPHRIVYSYTFPVEELGSYNTWYYIDQSKNPGYYQVKSVGITPRMYSVWRKVLDPTGEIVLIDESYTSRYAAIDEIVIIGPGQLAEDMMAEGRVKNANYSE